MKAIVTSTITFGLVSIPVKVCSAISSKKVRFSYLSPEGNRVAQKLHDPVTGEEVDRSSLQKGYEFAKGQYVTFSAEELKALDASNTSKTMAIQEFIPEVELSSLRVEKSYYLAPNKGGDKGYWLLAETLDELGMIAIAQWTNRNREHLVAIQPQSGGLILQQLYYDDEIQTFETGSRYQLDGRPVEISPAEKQMATMLIKQMASQEFVSSKYQDRYAQDLRRIVESKVLSATSVISAQGGSVQDLYTALKASLQPSARKKASSKKPARRKA